MPVSPFLSRNRAGIPSMQERTYAFVDGASLIRSLNNLRDALEDPDLVLNYRGMAARLAVP